MGYFLEVLRLHPELVETKQARCFILKNTPVSENYGHPCLRVIQTGKNYVLIVTFRSVHADTEWINLPDYLKFLDIVSEPAKDLWGIKVEEDDEYKFAEGIEKAIQKMRDVKTLEIMASLSPATPVMFWHAV